LGNVERQFFAIASISLLLSDSVLCSLLEDGRLAKNIDDVLSELKDEQCFAFSIPDDIFEVLAPVSGLSSVALRTEATASTLTSAAFLRHRLRDVLQLPWTLCGPSKSEKLEAFVAGPCPGEPVSAKIHHLLKVGFPQAEIITELELVENIDWTITPAEQGHRHASGLMRAHPDICQNSMQARSQLGQVVALLGDCDKTKAAEASLLRKLHRLERARPAAIHGRQEFVKSLSQLQQKNKKLGLHVLANAHEVAVPLNSGCPTGLAYNTHLIHSTFSASEPA